MALRPHLYRLLVAVCVAAAASGADAAERGLSIKRKQPRRHVVHRAQHSGGTHKLGKPHLKDDLLDRFIIVPEHKLLFCYIEKVACSSFNNIFRQLRAPHDPSQISGMTYHRNDMRAHNFTKRMLEEALADETWHKAVFYRDPTERFASAFASKCGHADPDGRTHCKRQFGKESLPFEEAVKKLQSFDAAQGPSADDHRSDPHFRRQGSFCGGLSSTIQYYNTVQELRHDTAHQKVSSMLSAVGADPEQLNRFEDFFPKGEEDKAWRKRSHNTAAGSKMDKYFPAGKPWLRDLVAKHYEKDYRLFGIPLPGT